MSLKKVLVLFAALFLSLFAGAQQTISHELDSFYSIQANLQNLMGNVVAEDHGIVVYKKSFGYQDIDKNIVNTDSSAFAMASVTKIFTATAILQLKEKGLLQLDDYYIKYFPDFPYPDITVRELLSHTSGLPAYELFDSLTKALPERIFGNADVTPALKLWHKPLHNNPGEGWNYSSMNYCLLAMLVEKLSGLTLQDYFSKYIFEPAGMHHSYLENYLMTRNNPNRTINYETPSHSPTPTDVNTLRSEHTMVYNCGGFIGQGGLVTTTADMLLFDKAYFSEKLINRQSIDEAMQPTKLVDGRPAVSGSLLGRGIAGYGLGWFIGIHPLLGKIVWHTGGRPGISAIYVHDVARDQAVFILQNIRNKANLGTIAANTLKMMNGLPASPDEQ